MDSLTMHNSSNFLRCQNCIKHKTQLANLNYIFNAYKIKKKNYNLNKLISDLTSLTKNNGFNFELAVAHYLNGNKKLLKLNKKTLFAKV